MPDAFQHQAFCQISLEPTVLPLKLPAPQQGAPALSNLGFLAQVLRNYYILLHFVKCFLNFFCLFLTLGFTPGTLLGRAFFKDFL
jgi:hypothetical protein